MKLKYTLAILLGTFSLNLLAQDPEHAGHELDHEHHSRNEIGLANSAVYFVGENGFAYGLHVHYLRRISHFGLGLGYERIFDTHKHNTIGFVMAYWPTEHLNLNFSPGLTFEDEHPEAKFAFHLEAAYGFEIGSIHLGPVIEFAYDPEDYHISLGLHLGFDF